MEQAASTTKTPKPVLVVCPKCKGAQFIRSARCRECKGSGKVEAK
jgi:DnaJ-class molecular chaperone